MLLLLCCEKCTKFNLNTVQKWTARRSHFWDLYRIEEKNERQACSRSHFWHRLAVPGTAKSQNQPRGRTQAQNKNDVYVLFIQQQTYKSETEGAPRSEAWFQATFRPKKWNLKANMRHRLSPFIGSNLAIAMQHHPCSIHQSISIPPTPLLRAMFHMKISM